MKIAILSGSVAVSSDLYSYDTKSDEMGWRQVAKRLARLQSAVVSKSTLNSRYPSEVSSADVGI